MAENGTMSVLEVNMATEQGWEEWLLQVHHDREALVTQQFVAKMEVNTRKRQPLMRNLGHNTQRRVACAKYGQYDFTYGGRHQLFVPSRLKLGRRERGGLSSV